MIHDPQHTLTHVAVKAPATLKLVFADGADYLLDLSETLRAYPALATLTDPEVFARARLDARGGYVIWIEDELEMVADNLRHLADEQAGGGHICGTGSSTYSPITSTGRQGATS